jgi:hypothetical protein
MCVRIGKAPSVDISSLRENYISPELLENQVAPDPFDQVWSSQSNFALIIIFLKNLYSPQERFLHMFVVRQMV